MPQEIFNVSPEDGEKTAVVQGPDLACVVLQRMTDQNSSFCINDVLVYSRNTFEHSTQHCQVFQQLRSADLTFHSHKCNIVKGAWTQKCMYKKGFPYMEESNEIHSSHIGAVVKINKFSLLSNNNDIHHVFMIS